MHDVIIAQFVKLLNTTATINWYSLAAGCYTYFIWQNCAAVNFLMPSDKQKLYLVRN